MKLHNGLLPGWTCQLALFILLLVSVSGFSTESDNSRERMSLDGGWRFTKGDPAGTGEQLSYPNIKNWILPAGSELTKDHVLAAKTRPAVNPDDVISYARSDLDDSNWRLLNLPHDWAIEGPFKQEYPGETGKLEWWGVGWYRKHLTIPAADAGRNIYLDVDGAMSYATVWLNGHCVGGWPYGYSSWRVDLTPFVKYGADNVLAIRLDNPKDSSRWYPGAGIYRNVWLVKTAPVHIAHWGTFVTTPQIDEKSATVKIQVNVENNSEANANVSLNHEIFEIDAGGKRGQLVASQVISGLNAAAHQVSPFEGQIELPKPRLWSLEHPQCYVVVTSVKQDGKVVDCYETPFGIRTIQFTADNGFLLNGKRVPIQGVCNHHDLGALGAAINTRALERQVELLKEMGCNAIRTSHNPPAPELLEVCDRLGMLVMDESFDSWALGKTPNAYNKLWEDWHEKDLRAEYRRDRNHPSIIMWSIGNEVLELGQPQGPAIAASLTAIAHDEDPTRPTVIGSNNGDAGYNGLQKCVDVFGQNYQSSGYASFRKANPTIPQVGSETASTVSSRGEYFFQTGENVPPVSEDKAQGQSDFQMSSYDLYAPPWATPPDAEFSGEDKTPSVAGEFVWTGFDYLGEPTPYNADLSNLLNFTDPEAKARMKQQLEELGKILVPSRSSYFGIFDLAGFRKDRFYLYQSRWQPDFPMAHILPHWNWPERVGQITPVFVYTSGDAAELFLNGKSLGLKKKGPFEYRLRWNEVVYQPGELKVVAYKGGKKWATDIVKTTGPAAKLMLQADRKTIRADGQDLSFVTVTVTDKNGLLVPRSKNHIQFALEGPGEIIAVDNGNATSFESFQAKERNAYNGLALVIVRSQPGTPGDIRLTASSSGLASAKTQIKSKTTVMDSLVTTGGMHD